MKNLFTVLFTIGMLYSAQAQTITDKKGTEFNVTDYETIIVSIPSSKLHPTKLSGDGYDEIRVNNRATIVDGKRVTTGKGTKKLSKNKGFWTTFLKRNGFVFENTTTEERTFSVNGNIQTAITIVHTYVKK